MATINASGLDNALDALDITTDKKTEIDRHPERRRKAARAAWEENLKKQWEAEGYLEEHNKKKLHNRREELNKLWNKAPENPMNQVSAAYNATQEEMEEIRAQEKEKIENRLAEK